MHTVLRCLSPHPVARVKHRTHGARLGVADGLWLATGNRVSDLAALEAHPGNGRLVAWCSKCKIGTEYERPDVVEEKVPA